MKITDKEIEAMAEDIFPHYRLQQQGYIKGFKQAQSMDEWVSVSDRLPNINEMVLVFMLGRITKKPVMKVDELTQDGWRLTDAGFITHWQPLPPPPQTSK